jgi:hypothetical protein
MSTPANPGGRDNAADQQTAWSAMERAGTADRPGDRAAQNRLDAPPTVSGAPLDVDPGTEPVDRRTVLAEQKQRFGGMKAGAAFFGWLTATGMAVLLIAVLGAAGVAFGVTNNQTLNRAVDEANAGTGTAQTVGLVGAIVLLVVLFVAYYCGGYVAGRMARFNGAKQGLAVWLWGILTALVVAAIAAIAGAQYNIFAQLNLPRIPVNEGQVTLVGAIAIAAAVLAALAGALLGGVTGMRFHRTVDAAGFDLIDQSGPSGSSV